MREERRMEGWPSLLVLLVAAQSVGVACKSSSPAEGNAPATSSGGQAFAVSSNASDSGEPTVMKRVSDADCAQWADHGSEVVVSGFAEASRGCSQKVKDDVASKFIAQKVSLRDGAKALCVQHLNGVYRAQDGACFLAATNARDMVACKLAPMTSPGDSDWAQMIDDLREKCGVRIAPSAGPTPSPTL